MTEPEQQPVGVLVEVKPDPSPLGIYQLAIEKGVPAAELSKLLDLHERIEAKKAEAAFAADMNACQGEMPTVVRDKRNSQTNKMYAPVETIQADAKPIYSRHGFSLSFTSEPGTAPELTTMHLDISHVGGHTKRMTLPNVPLDDKGPKGGDVKTKIQGLKSSMSYAKGMLICMAFNITVADEDKDGQGGSFVTADQIGEINDLIAQRERAGQKPSLSGFLHWLGVDSLDKLPQRDLEKALAEQRRKLGQVQEANK